ncbi:MAG: D-Ala-D-Ala carboxypeptidase family metallohydrolase [Sphingomicrobium sp.]
MLKSFVSVALLVSATGAWAASSNTDFGIRAVGVRTNSGQATTVVTNSTSKALLVASNVSPVRATNTMFSDPSPIRSSGVNLRAVASLGSQWGRVTSTIRSVAHNRSVGGVRNSWHLSGRAVDIARRRGVSHAQIAAAFRNAGYRLIESLDEGDHSHFAFGGSGASSYASQAATARSTGAVAVASTPWKIVTAANAAFR